MTRRFLFALSVAAALILSGRPAAAQGPPPKIGPLAVDLHVTIPRFPHDAQHQQLADSRGLLLPELPGSGLGLHGAATLYFFKWRAVTFGLGADVTLARAHEASKLLSATTASRPVTEQFTHAAPDLSFNFGTGDGWSYLSGGIGPGIWFLVPDGSPASAADVNRLQTINYGGGARWFNSRHLAFSFDVRFYAVEPTAPDLTRPSSPRTTLVFIGGGISIK